MSKTVKGDSQRHQPDKADDTLKRWEKKTRRLADAVNGRETLHEPGTRGWFWEQRMVNALLFILPLYPLASALGSLHDPKALVLATAPGVKATAPDGEVTSVVVHLKDPTLLDYLLLAGPGLLGAIVIAVLCRALYRITVNFGTHSQPYTDRDHAVLRRARLIAVVTWFPLVGLGVGSYIHFNGLGSIDLLGMTILTLILAAVIEYAEKIYVKGRSFHEELEKGV